MFERVVVGIQEDETGRDAVALSKELASGRGELTLLHVHLVTSKSAPDSGSVRDAAKRRYALERLTALAAELSIEGEVLCLDALSARRGLHQFASQRRADLLVVGASRVDEVAQDLLGDDTRAVLEDAPCPVAVAPAGFAARAGAMKRIGVGYDGSVESERALALARNLAIQHHAELSAFEAVEPPVNVRDQWDVKEEIDGGVEAARQRIAALGGLEPEAALGDAATELTEYARSVDLLVLGSHKYRPIDRLLEQSTSQRLADAASSPLLVLSSAG